MARKDMLEALYNSTHKTIDGIEYKKCRQCGEWLKLNKNNFHQNKRLKDGFTALCKICTKNKEGRIPKKKDFNTYEVRGDTTAIFLTNNSGEDLEALIDTEDLPKLIAKNISWHPYWEPTSEFYYVMATDYYYDDEGKYKAKTLYLHRFILDVTDRKIQVDHKDNNTLDNRKINLRQTDHSRNAQNRKSANKNNTTGHRNVNWGNGHRYYVVQFMKNGERFKWEFPLDKYDEACKFADEKRIELFGEYAGRS